MSLEQALAENTAAIKELIAVWSKLNTQAKAIDKNEKVEQVVAAGKPVKAATEKAAAAAETSASLASSAGASTPDTTATTASPSEAAPEVDFDTLKKAFLALSTKEGGRAKCEGVLKPHGLAKLSEAKPEQYGALLTAINQASA